ncbi:MAG TPA: GFA family protein [Archangium sp.]
MTTHKGSCHCGAVKFEVDLELNGGATRCNCTICTKLGGTGATVKPAALRVLQGEASMSTYTVNPVATRYFCSKCGVHCFSRGNIPQLGGAYAGVHVNALDDLDLGTLKIGFWDGRHNNWQAGLRDAPWPV